MQEGVSPGLSLKGELSQDLSVQVEVLGSQCAGRSITGFQ